MSEEEGLTQEVFFLAYHLHWSREEILALPIGERRTYVELLVKRLEADNRDPQIYRERMSSWEQRLVTAGAEEFRVFVDEQRLVEALNQKL